MVLFILHTCQMDAPFYYANWCTYIRSLLNKSAGSIARKFFQPACIILLLHDDDEIA